MRGILIAAWAFCVSVVLATSTYGQDTATFTVRSHYGSPDPPAGTWTYELNSVITASVATPVYGYPGIRYICTGWRARGSPGTLPSEGTENSVTFTITMNTTLTWTWKTQYRLTTSVTPEGGGAVDVSPTSADGYYYAKSTITLTAIDNEGYDFSYWSGSLRGIENPQDMLLRGPREVIANFILEKRLFSVFYSYDGGEPILDGQVEVDYGSTVEANCGVTPYSGGEGVQYACIGHLGTGDVTDGPETSISFAIYHDSSVTWLWQTQYYLTIASAYGDPQGAGWYGTGTTANWSVTSPWPPDATDTRYITSPTSGEVLMDAPHTVDVAWTTQYYLTTSVLPADTGTITCVPSSPWYDSDTVVTLTAIPNTGYVFTNWSGDLNGSENPKDLMMDGPKSVTANFTLTCTLTIRSQYGSPDPPAGIWTYLANTVITASVATPVYGYPGIRYICTGWRARGSPETLPSEGTENSVTFTITMNTTLTWTWKTQYRLTTSVTPEGSGAVDVSPTSADGYYDAKSTIMLAAIDNEGYDFSYWSGSLRGIENPQDMLLRGPRHVMANFVLEKRYFTVNSARGEPSPAVGVHEYDYGTLVIANCGLSPYPGPTGTQYVYTGYDATAPDVPSAGTETMIMFTITEDCSVTWNWQTQYYLTVDSPHGDPQGEGWYNEGDTAHWSVTSPWSGGTGIQYITSPTSGDVLMDEPETVTVLWTTQYRLTTAADPSAGGSVSPSGETWYNAGAVVGVTGIANDGYVFTNWSGDLSGTENPKNITMDGPMSVTANFVAQVPVADFTGVPTSGNVPLTVVFTDESTGNITSWEWDFGAGANPATANTQGPHSVTYSTAGLKTVSLTASGPGGSDTETKVDYITATVSQCQLTVNVLPEGGGTVMCVPPGPVYDGGTVVTLTASPNEGYIWGNWSGDLSTTENPTTITMDGDKTVTANFVLEKRSFEVISDYGEPVPAAGTYEYDYGTTVNANCGPTPYSGGAGTEYLCTGHLGAGNVTDGTETSVSFVITLDSSVTWTWQTKYYLTVVSAYGNPQGEGWYNEGETAYWSVTSPWSGGTGTQYVASPASGDVLMDAPKTVTVSWTTQYRLTTAANPSDGGSVTPSGESWHNENAVVTLTADANPGYGFTNWSGDLSGTENPKDLTMNEPKSVTANFALTPVAGFTGTPTSSISSPLTVQFTDESTGSMTSWEWDFDNNGVVDSTERNPAYTYTSSGRYTVKLTVTGLGGPDEETKTDYIRVCNDANVIYVSTKGNDSNNGLSWDQAVKTIQTGINLASNDWSVRAAKGTYKGTGNVELDFGGMAIHLIGVVAPSGNVGADWIIDGGNTLGQQGFIFLTGETAHSVVDNFTIQKCVAFSGDDGGGIYCYGASPTIINCRVSANKGDGGGGIYCAGGSNATITNCTINNNQAISDNGGGIECYNANPRITNCTIQNNSAPGLLGWGGAIYCRSSSPIISNCTISGNTASDQGGGVYLEADSDATITGCEIYGNSADWYGGGIYCESSAPTITNSTIGGALGGNSAGDTGGGICLYTASPTVTNCVVTNNSAVYAAGGIECWNDSSPLITNCLIANNSATGTDTGYGNGGAIDCYSNCIPTITNCTIANNTATNDGGGMSCYVSAPVLMNNTIIWGNIADSDTSGAGLGNQIYTWKAGSYACIVTLNYCDYENGTNDIAGNGTVIPNDSIVSDPLFVDTESGNYRLQAISPCIDAGSNSLVPAGVTTDLDGNARIQNGTVDIGAYESAP